MTKYLNKLKVYLLEFMRGRNGSDDLNRFLTLLVFALIIINSLFFDGNLVLVVYIFLAIILFRFFSKNLWTRQKENLTFLDDTKKYRHIFKKIKLNLSDKSNKYFICPNCKQMVKVPRGRGKIEIRCPRCNHTFDKKS